MRRLLPTCLNIRLRLDERQDYQDSPVVSVCKLRSQNKTKQNKTLTTKKCLIKFMFSSQIRRSMTYSIYQFHSPGSGSRLVDHILSDLSQDPLINLDLSGLTQTASTLPAWPRHTCMRSTDFCERSNAQMIRVWSWEPLERMVWFRQLGFRITNEHPRKKEADTLLTSIQRLTTQTDRTYT